MAHFGEAINHTHVESSTAAGPVPNLRQVNFDRETPPYSRTEAMKSFRVACCVSKKIQQVMGMRDPEPFVRPPEMSEELEKLFVLGLKEYGLDYRDIKRCYKRGLETLSEATGPQGRTKVVRNKSMLPDIKEEKENPVRIAYTSTATVQADSCLAMKPPVHASGQQPVADMCNHFTKTNRIDERLSSENSESTCKRPLVTSPSKQCTISHKGDNGADVKKFSALSSFSLAQMSNVQAGSAQVQTFARALDCGNEHRRNGAGYSTSQQPTSSFDLQPPNHDRDSTGISEAAYNHTQTGPAEYHRTSQETDLAPRSLFPSPRVQEQSRGVVQPKADFKLPTSSHGTNVPNMSSKDQTHFLEDLSDQSSTPKVPKITVQSPSPTKKPESKKRASSLTAQESFGPPLTRNRPEDDTGLPVVPAESELLWKFHFPGNTQGLLKTLLAWSCTMRSMYNQYPNPQGFPYNTAFPWPIRPPTYEKLISISFYDTAVQPHKEIRFLGPGDAANIIYSEVDTFRDQKVFGNSQEHRMRGDKVGSIKTTLGLNNTGTWKYSRHMPMHQRAATGEGRWVFVLITACQTTKETPPYVLIAFHVSAITKSSISQHNISPDNHPPSFPPAEPSHPCFRSFNSQQNLVAERPNPLRRYQAIRSASNSEQIQPDSASILSQDGAQTLHRTVLYIERAGNIPLMEGYKVNVAKFRGWQNAVARGNGKLVMWKEKN